MPLPQTQSWSLPHMVGYSRHEQGQARYPVELHDRGGAPITQQALLCGSPIQDPSVAYFCFLPSNRRYKHFQANEAPCPPVGVQSVVCAHNHLRGCYDCRKGNV